MWRVGEANVNLICPGDLEEVQLKSNSETGKEEKVVFACVSGRWQRI